MNYEELVKFFQKYDLFTLVSLDVLFGFASGDLEKIDLAKC